jgi:hypothetical protein
MVFDGSRVVIPLAAACAVALARADPVNLLVNGGFEGSTSQTATPPGWTNIGHSDGVIAYSAVGLPAYEGLNFYDLGGFGMFSPQTGDGIQQTVATIVGAAYTLTFGLSSENRSGSSTLRVLIGTTFVDYPFVATTIGNEFRVPLTTQTIDYVATSTSTTISFIEGANPQFGGAGNNDPLIDGVVFATAAISSSTVPEPATLGLVASSLLALAALRRQRRDGISVDDDDSGLEVGRRSG